MLTMGEIVLTIGSFWCILLSEKDGPFNTEGTMMPEVLCEKSFFHLLTNQIFCGKLSLWQIYPQLSLRFWREHCQIYLSFFYVVLTHLVFCDILLMRSQLSFWCRIPSSQCRLCPHYCSQHLLMEPRRRLVRHILLGAFLLTNFIFCDILHS